MPYFVSKECQGKKHRKERQNDDVSNGPGVSGMEPFTMSTSTFLDQKGIAWNSLATTFGCEEVKDESILMSELLSLCNFWGESEPVFEGMLDYDDIIIFIPIHRLKITKRSNEKLVKSSSSTMISNLHFNSTLCLKSNSGRDPGKLSETTCQLPICACPSTSTETHQCLSVKEKCLSDEKRLESAFMGIMDDDNEMSRDGVPSETVANDFWSSVQF
ncbi:hypothetical protein DICVIV_07941 [Dictyocaulus viviparus]|uniref:Uncharacterized protein n=1 Tax=Dictyocaulus viviparus TaxID=29172 RepID=A0A0D8XMW6_DICVI|nr:hypothetical protein DICVIV_07941 [Dictyocaulus viviparus]